MRRYELVGRRELVLDCRVPRPKPHGDEVLVAVKSCTVCGRSDLVYYHYLGLRDHCANGQFGHEISGVVEAVGPCVRSTKPGDRVFVRFPLTSGFAEYALAREIAIGRLPESISFEHGSILQLLPLAIHSTRGVRLGDRVLIIGQGPVGLMALQVARLRGAASVSVSDLDPWRLERSKILGADDTYAVQQLPIEQHLMDTDPNEGIDVAIDAVGTPTTAASCVDLVRHNGLVIFLGTHHIDTHVTFDLVQWEKKSLRIHTSAEPTDTARQESMSIAQRLVDRGKVQLEPLLTRAAVLTELPDVIAQLSESVVLYPQGEVAPYSLPPKETLKVAVCL